MPKTKNGIPDSVKQEVETRVDFFNTTELAKGKSQYVPFFRGKFIYLKRIYPGNRIDEICRLTYTGDLENTDFAIFRYSTETYDPDEYFFNGAGHFDGTLEGAMRAGLEAYED